VIVCLCRGASERDVRHAARRGATVDDLKRECIAGGDCGSCHELLDCLLDDELPRCPIASAPAHP
jgi:bacterioferritin-associated ferredoxin